MMSARRTFRLGTSWEYPDSDRSLKGYLWSASRRPTFWTGFAAAIILAIAGYKDLGIALTVAVYLGGLLVLMAIGYFVWRRAGRFRE